MQSTLEQAIASVTQEPTRVVGSGRTDAGAHALGQVIVFDAATRLQPDVLLRAVNAHLPRDVVLSALAETRPDFHPRFDATSRAYRYLIWNRDVRSPLWEGRAAHVSRWLDIRAMDRAAQELLGTHDFGAFVATGAGDHRTRRIFRAECRREGHLVTIELEGSGFMRQMVRAIVGTLVRAGLGKLDPRGVRAILESQRRSLAGETAPACGLYLLDVRYPAAVGGELLEETE